MTEYNMIVKYNDIAIIEYIYINYISIYLLFIHSIKLNKLFIKSNNTDIIIFILYIALDK